MFKGLQQKWKVNGWQLLLIISTFALGGSLCGYTGRRVLQLMDIDSPWFRVILYIIIITLLWPLCVIVVSIPLGQFKFFLIYIQKIGRRVFGKKVGITENVGRRAMADDQKNEDAETRSTSNGQRSTVKHIAIFASGTGTNAQAIINHFKNSSSVKIALIISNKPDAGVLKITEKENIPSIIIDKEKFFRGNAYVDELKEKKIDFIVLAGFLWKIPSALIKAYPNKIINIHPALLPKYGGKGMYGHHVHETVIVNKEKESGITIHFVDELYDHGSIIFQATCSIDENDTADILAGKIHKLEHENFPRVIEEVVKKAASYEL